MTTDPPPVRVCLLGVEIALAHVSGAGVDRAHRWQWITLTRPPRRVAYSSLNRK